MRPTGVVLIALYHFLSALFLLLLSLSLFVGGSILKALGNMGQSPIGAGVGLLVGVVGGAIFFCYALVAFFAGYGLWTVREWGRILSIVLAVLSLLFSLPGLLAFHLHLFFGAYRLFRLAISILIIWYLMQPQIKALFRRSAALT